MALSGFQAALAAQAEQAAREAARRANSEGAWKYELKKLVVGESVVIRVLPVPDQPFVFMRHGLANANDRIFHVPCANIGGAPCPACAAANADRSKRVKPATLAGSFAIISTRRLMEKPPRQGSTFPTLEPIRVNAAGQHLLEVNGVVTVAPGGVNPEASRYPTREEGSVLLTVSLHSKGKGNGLMALEKTLQDQCKCRRPVGEAHEARYAGIRHVSWHCSECDAPVNHDPLRGPNVRCTTCRHEGAPSERTRCEADCGNPQRLSMTDSYIRMTAVGTGLDATYSFEALPPSVPAPQHVSVEVQDRRKLYAPNLQVMRSALSARSIPVGDVPPGGGGGGPQGGGIPGALDPSVGFSWGG